MSNAIEPGYVVPTPQPAKTIGLLNIVFATLLLLMSLMSIASVLMMPAYVRLMQVQQQKLERDAQKAADAGTEQALRHLEEQEKAAKTDEEKAAYSSQRRALKNRPKPFVPDMTLGFKIANDPLYRNYQMVDYATGIPLNLALLASGIALLRLRRWGRSLAMWVAMLKFVRAVGFLLASVLIISPAMTKTMGGYLDQTGKQIASQQGGNPANAAKVQQAMQMMTRVMGAIITGSYAIYFSLAMIYPVVILVILNRPGVRAALVAKPVTQGDTLT